MSSGRNRPKFGMLELLKLCRKYGIEEEGVKTIAQELGVTKNLVLNKIDEYCIIPNLYNKDL